MNEVPHDERTAPQSFDDMELGTLYGLRNAAIAHGQDRYADQVDAEIRKREKGAGKRR